MTRRASEHRFTFLLGALLLLLITSPLAPLLRAHGHERVGAALTALLFVIVMMAAVPAVGKTGRTVAIALILVVPSIALRSIDVFHQHSAVQFVHLLTGVLFLLFAIVLIAGYLLGASRVTLNTVNAALCIYMLFGVLWACAYSLLELLEPGAFALPTPRSGDATLAGTNAESATDLLYYSFTTLTTLGYGDITPRSAFARMFAVTEAVVGQLILVVLVAHLVGLRVAQSTQNSADHAPEQ
jgi:hypothetical protein